MLRLHLHVFKLELIDTALTMLILRQEERIRPVNIEWWGVGLVILERGADCLHMVKLMPLHPQTPSSLASFKSRLVLPFWYLLTQLSWEKKPLNGCSSSSSSDLVAICQRELKSWLIDWLVQLDKKADKHWSSLDSIDYMHREMPVLSMMYVPRLELVFRVRVKRCSQHSWTNRPSYTKRRDLLRIVGVDELGETRSLSSHVVYSSLTVQMGHRHGRPHIGANGVSWPPGKKWMKK